ncbi:2-succinyl-5-enolpyruvyl-6-hydroxy-3-cyclohexene-1-carboxylic-acid synthase [Alicyclobacillaceae bacterium I2511]|nr:2-succinyl-5-enolpyruvyl-6-hydroxy-3-cyclohexene-1-carboxylic-acid synthase [Alicyclobacillaceae bacterium I2511]
MTVQGNEQLRPVHAFAQGLVEAGVCHVCISPGSRSTPLTIVLSRHPQLHTWLLLDERSAGFFALGLAKQTRTGVALVCTSGTAAGNYLPAVMEAAAARVPLIVLTADRPPELYDTGANQTGDQLKLYGSYAKWFTQMPVPENTPQLFAQAKDTASRAVMKAMAPPAGPVQVNWPFREPLLPPLAEQPKESNFSTTDELFSVTQPTRAFWGKVVLSDEEIHRLAAMLQKSRAGVLVCGPQDSPGLASAVTELAAVWGVPLLADPLSQLRGGGSPIEAQLQTTYDLWLRNATLRESLRPDLILRLGRVPTSKFLGLWLAEVTASQVVVDDGQAWHDPFFRVTGRVFADPEDTCHRLAQCLSQASATVSVGDGPQARGEWLQSWTEIQKISAHSMSAGVKAASGIFEGRIFTELFNVLPSRSTLFVGNSMPVRDLDAFWPNRVSGPTRILANRGLSGIDGVVSSALGACGGRTDPLVLVIGDVSFYHDLGGLMAATRHHLHCLIVLVHNDGGGIFYGLPQATQPDTFGFFRTSHGLDFQSAVEMYGGQYQHPKNWQEFRGAVQQGLAQDTWTVVQVDTDAQASTDIRQSIAAQVAVALGVTRS